MTLQHSGVGQAAMQLVVSGSQVCELIWHGQGDSPVSRGTGVVPVIVVGGSGWDARAGDGQDGRASVGLATRIMVWRSGWNDRACGRHR